MTATGKIAVSLPVKQIDAARQAVREGRAASVSSYVSEALARRQQDDALAHLVAGWMAEDGVPSDDDYVWADAVLGQATAARPRRRREQT
jgi:Arc/MetJ-type ribon-helix-helix transcriptional regulator